MVAYIAVVVLVTVASTSSVAALYLPQEKVLTAAPAPPEAAYDPRLIGYWSMSGSYSTSNCDSSSTLAVNGLQARCCHVESAHCRPYEGCLGQSFVFNGDGVSSCSNSRHSCQTARIYENHLAQRATSIITCSDPEATAGLTFYLVPPAVTPTAATSFMSPIMETTQETHIHTPRDSNGGSSKAWIAGVIIGPLLVVIIALYINKKIHSKPRRRRAKNAPEPLPADPNANNYDAVYPPVLTRDFATPPPKPAIPPSSMAPSSMHSSKGNDSDFKY